MTRIGLLLSVSAAVLLAVGCQNKACDPGTRDWGQETFGMALPKPPGIDFAVVPAELVERYYQGPARMAGMLAQGDFAGVQAHWDAVAAMTDRTEQMRAVVRSLDALEGRGLYTLNMAQAWYQAHPESEAARLMLAATFVRAAREGAVHYYQDRDSGKEEAAGHLHKLEARLAQARPLLDALLQADGFYGMAAREVNLYAGFMGGSAEAAWNAYLELIAYAPHYEWLYLRAAAYAEPRFSGGKSEARFETLTDLAIRQGLPEIHQTALWQQIDEYRNSPEKNPNPQAWRPYWQARVKAAPTLNNYLGWMKAEDAVSNWPALLELIDKVLAINPDHKLAWEHKSLALRQLGRTEEAYRAAVVAALLGSDRAMDQIVQAYVRGGLGLPVGDFKALYEYCKLGAGLGLASAANCMGSAHSEGFAGVARNDQEALRWHFLGARGGHANSQHDVAVLLPRLVKNPALATDVDKATGYWLRLAAMYGHPAAKNKLAARPEWGAECLPDGYPEILQRLIWLVRLIL